MGPKIIFIVKIRLTVQQAGLDFCGVQNNFFYIEFHCVLYIYKGLEDIRNFWEFCGFQTI